MIPFATKRQIRSLGELLSARGMPLILLLLCVFFSWATFSNEPLVGRDAGDALFTALTRRTEARKETVVIVARRTPDDTAFAETLEHRLASSGRPASAVLRGEPPEVRRQLDRLAGSGGQIDVVATTADGAGWSLFRSIRERTPSLSRMEVLAPESRGRSAFLSPGNLRNVVDQIAVIAILAIGMTLVILTGGIDLSVGSLIAFSAVLAAWIIARSGGESATVPTMMTAGLAAVAASGAVGGVSGAMITFFGIPPFIATLAMMQVASGLAFLVARGQSIYDIPASFTLLGRGAGLLSLPNAVVLMAILYVAAHLTMSRTAYGRALYALGGNPKAARLSGLPTKRLLFGVYCLSGLAAGIGGVITASQLKAGAPTYGLTYELYVIAAVVVGGASLTGGEGTVFGTLIGAFIIAVIRNGMNLMNVEPYTQKIVLGLVILGAVLLDRLKRRQEA